MPLVVDASVLVFATTETTRAAGRVVERLRNDVCHAPHLIDAEFGDVLRRKALRGEVEAEIAASWLAVGPRLIDHRHEHHGPLSIAAWALRDNVSFYDGLYVALAATFEVPLLTLDRRLARAPGLPCPVELAGSL